MAKRISLDELERLLADDATPDEVLAPYFKPAPLRTMPLAPVLVVDPYKVDSPVNRGLFGLTVKSLNDRANRKRKLAYEARIAKDWKGLKLLAEGDSWFLYPILLRDVVDHLNADYAIYSEAAAGDTLENMVRGSAYLESLIEQHGFHGLLLSAGGNDIAGDPLRTYLVSGLPPATSADKILGQPFDRFLAQVQVQFDTVIARLTRKSPDLKIFCHGYDWPFPLGGGIWLEPAFTAAGIVSDARAPVLKLMIDRFYDMLHTLAQAYPGRVFIVDCRGSVGRPDQWFDELHPMDQGFARVADRFRGEINKAFGMTATPHGLVAQVTWGPHEDRSGVSAQSRQFPPGATVLIGRSPERDLMLDDTHVSRTHARLTIGLADADLEDTDSSNGTMLDGRRVQRSRWTPGQKVRIGSYDLELAFVAAKAAVPAVVPIPAPAVPVTPAAGGSAPGLLTPSALGFMSPVAKPDAVAAPAPGVLQPLQIVLSQSSITRQRAPAMAIGVFQNVNPVSTRGAARAIDESTDGLLSDILESNMIDARLGTVSMLTLPSERGAMGSLFLTGLGAIGDFAPKALETAGECLARRLVATGIFEFATIPIGSNSGLALKDCIERFLTGVLRGIQAADHNRQFKRVTVCELKPDRYAQLKEQVAALAAADAFAKVGFAVDVVVDDATKVPPPPGPDATQSAMPDATDATSHVGMRVAPLPLAVMNVPERNLNYFLLAGEQLAARPRFRHTVDMTTETGLMAQFRDLSLFDAIFGKAVADAYLPEDLQQSVLATLAAHGGHLVVEHDRETSNVPWEVTSIGGQRLALDYGVSRTFCHDPSLTKKLGRRRAPIVIGAMTRMLVIQNPTGDLSGAETEAHELIDLFRARGAEVTVLSGAGATLEAVQDAMRTGRFDILHHAGHAGFVENDPARSGIVLRDHVVFSADDMADIDAVPHLIFLNACQSGRLREQPADVAPPGSVAEHASLAEGFLMHGVANFIGTSRPVNDAAAQIFALSFYENLLSGVPLGIAMRTARQNVEKANKRDWAYYLHFGDPAYVLSKPGPQGLGSGAAVPESVAPTRSGEPDPLAGEGAPEDRLIVFESNGDRAGLDLPVSRTQAIHAALWLKTHFLDQMQATVHDTPFNVDHLCGIACQETAYFWVGLIDKLPVQVILERCVLDASGEFPGTNRSVFPVDTAAFEARLGGDFAQLLIGEANKTRALRNYGPKSWVYKGYGVFQYDLQYVLSDPEFFRERQWYDITKCLAKARTELMFKYNLTRDIKEAIRAYNGAGPAARRYAVNVMQYTEWSSDILTA
jgi:CHAT domain/FHA domain/Cytosol aminopeptidase family, N-terminal domain